MIAGPGHNGGPSLEGGTSWRRHCWTQARERLLPTLPIEVVRLRVKRAATSVYTFPPPASRTTVPSPTRI